MSFSGEFDFLAASLAVSQTTDLAVGDHVAYDQFFRRGTRLNMTLGAGQARGIFTLQGGGTYRISLGVLTDFSVATTGQSVFHFTDAAGVSVPTVEGGFLEVSQLSIQNTGTNISYDPFMVGIVQPAATITDGEVRIITATALNRIVLASTYITIEAIDRPS